MISKPVTKGQTLHNSIYMKYPKWAKSQRQKVDEKFPETELQVGNGELLLDAFQVSACSDEVLEI